MTADQAFMPADSGMLERLLNSLRSYHLDADAELVIRAFDVAAQAHHGQLRRSGEAYITHPVAVAEILAELGMSDKVLAAALLHDTIEDTYCTPEQLREAFGDEVVALVEGVTKIDNVTYGPDANAETVRKMIVAMSRDIRVLVIKLADRLHNMRTIWFMSDATRERKATETLDIFAPLAHRLGMNTIKWELEDLSFEALQPKIYAQVRLMVDHRAPAREKFLGQVLGILQSDLASAHVDAVVAGRPKHYYSIYLKMIERGRSLDEIHDLVGVRVLTNTIPQAYAALGVVHSRWTPVPGRFKDYMAMPKFGVYQSLHTTVIGPEGKAVEVQIRTHEMHQAAEYGVAAHWRYKQKSVGTNSSPSDSGWVRNLVDWQQEVDDPEGFLEALRYDLAAKEIFVFTPRGDVKALPEGATPVDFAYAVHTEIGHRCVGARVNGQLVALDSTLTSGDRVEILTSSDAQAGPSLSWLDFVASGRAKSKIKSWHASAKGEDVLDKGSQLLGEALRSAGLGVRLAGSGNGLAGACVALNLATVEELYEAIGQGRVQASAVVVLLVGAHGGSEGLVEEVAGSAATSRRKTKTSSTGIMVEDLHDVATRLAQCCTPVPGDEVFGYVTRGSGVSVHRVSCTNADGLRLDEQRLVKVRWDDQVKTRLVVRISVEAIDRPGLLSDLTRALSDQKANVVTASVGVQADHAVHDVFTVEVSDGEHLRSVLACLRGVEGVFDVART